MAVEPSICVSSDSENLFVYDTTYAQSGSNPDGWGPTNKQPGNVDSATLQIWTPGAEDPIEIDALAGLPNKDGNGFRVHPDMLGMEQIKSGVYRVRVIYKDEDDVDENDNPWTARDNAYHLSTCLVACCISKKSVETSLLDDPTQTHQMEMLLKDAERSARVGQTDEAERIMTYLNLQCRC